MADINFSVESKNKPTLIAALRQNLPGKLSWTAVRKMVDGRRVTIGGVLCIDEARRLAAGEKVCVSDRPVKPPPGDADVEIHFIDKHIVVAETSGQVGAIHSTINLVLKTSYIDLISTRNEAMLKLIKACKSPGFKPDGVQQPIKAQQKGLHSKLSQGN